MPTKTYPNKATEDLSVVVPLAMPLKGMIVPIKFNHDAAASHEILQGTKDKPGAKKRFISKKVAANSEATLFHEHHRTTVNLRQELMALTRNQVQQPAIETVPELPQMTGREFFERDPDKHQRLKAIAEKICVNTNIIMRNDSFDELMRILKIAAKTNNVIARDVPLLSQKKMRTVSALESTLALIEKNILGQAQLYSQKDNSSAAATIESNLRTESDSTIISEKSSIRTVLSEVSIQEDQLTKEKIKNHLNQAVANQCVELIIFNLKKMSREAVTNEEKIFFHKIMTAIYQSSKGSNLDSLSASDRINAIFAAIPAFEQLLQNHTTIRSLFESYIQSVNILENSDYIGKILQHFDGRLTKDIMEELLKASEFPIKRTVYMKESADASREVFAQELIRALAPTVALMSNPYPKYRITTTTSEAFSGLGIVPQIPEIFVSSEKISFNCTSIGYAQKDDRGELILDSSRKKSTYLAYYTAAADGSSYDIRPLEDIVGFGTTMQFAKWLGDTDAKLGNLGVREYPDGSVQLTRLDSGLCFFVNPEVYKDSNEVVTPSLQTTETLCNYLFQRSNWQHYPAFDDFFEQSAEHPQVKRENRITALHIALWPPEAAEVFARQYLIREGNPFMANNDHNPNYLDNEVSFDSIVFEHVISKSDATFENFLKDDRLFRYFLEPSRSQQDNIFAIFQSFALQLESFKFYEKRHFDEALRDAGQQESITDMIEKRFIELISKKFESSNALDKRRLRQLLEEWNPSQLGSESDTRPAITEKSVQKSQLLRDTLLTKWAEQEAKILHKDHPQLVDNRLSFKSTSGKRQLPPLNLSQVNNQNPADHIGDLLSRNTGRGGLLQPLAQQKSGNTYRV